MSTHTHSATSSQQSRIHLPAAAELLRAMLLRRLTWLLLVCYSLMLLKPVVPVLADVLAHTFNERQHLMTVHEEHGRFHIHYEQQKQEGNTGKGRPSQTTKYQQDDYVHVVTNLNAVAPALHTNRPLACAGYACHYPWAEGDQEYIPPRS